MGFGMAVASFMFGCFLVGSSLTVAGSVGFLSNLPSASSLPSKGLEVNLFPLDCLAIVVSGSFSHFRFGAVILLACQISNVAAVTGKSLDGWCNTPMAEPPYAIFWDGSVHCGNWSSPYIMESASTVTYVSGKMLYHKGYIPPIAIPPPKVEGEECHDRIGRVKLGGGVC